MTLPLVQPGFRLFAGEVLNAIINQLNSVSEGFEPINTAIATAGAGTLTAAGLLGGYITRSGPSAAYTDTTATGTQLDTALGDEATSGFSRVITIKNTVPFTETVAGGVGVTVSGVAAIPGNSVGTFLLTRTGTATYTLVGLGASSQATFNSAAVVGTADNGTTQTLTAAMISGGNFTSHLSTGGTTPSLTLPLGSSMDTALAGMAVGQSYVLRVINANSGTATIVTNTGWTLTGTLTLLTNTWRDFVVTKTGTATYTAVQVGTGATS